MLCHIRHTMKNRVPQVRCFRDLQKEPAFFGLALSFGFDLDAISGFDLRLTSHQLGHSHKSVSVFRNTIHVMIL